MQTWTWTKTRERAAQLVADGQQNDTQIAAALQIGGRTLDYWKVRPEFHARVEAHLAAFREKIRAEGIANRQNRVDALNDRWGKLHQIAQERGADPAMATIPGGTTGYLVHQVKQLGGGPSAQIIDEYVLDTGLLSELRANEQQAAKELGQWTEKRETTGKDGGPIDVHLQGGIEVRAVDYRMAIKPLLSGAEASPSAGQDVRE